MKSLRLATIIALMGVLLSGCAGMQLGPNTTTGIGVGAVAGAVLNRDNPAAGALLGGALGGAVGSAVDNDQGYRSGPVYNGGYGHGGGYNRCDWRCQDEMARREAIRREELRRQYEWQEYCRYNYRRDYRCRR